MYEKPSRSNTVLISRAKQEPIDAMGVEGVISQARIPGRRVRSVGGRIVVRARPNLPGLEAVNRMNVGTCHFIVRSFWGRGPGRTFFAKKVLPGYSSHFPPLLCAVFGLSFSVSGDKFHEVCPVELA